MTVDETHESNMKHLGLTREQYTIHCKVAGNMSLAPQGMRDYCVERGRRESFCGEALIVWMADYIKAHPEEVAHLA